MKSDQNESFRAQQNEELLFREFFKLSSKIKSNFGISVLIKFKLKFSPIWNLSFKLFSSNSHSSTQN